MKHNIWRPESSIIFVGFQAMGTLGRKIVDGEREVQIFRETYRVRSKVYTIGGFSSHADRNILLDWLGRSKGTDRIFIVHGEEEGAVSFRRALQDRNLATRVHVPHYGDVFQL